MPAQVATLAQRMLRLTRQKHRDHVVLTVDGEVDLLTRALLVEQIDLTVAAASEHAAAMVVIDLRGVEFFGSVGLDALVRARAAVQERNLALRIVATTDTVLQPLVITGLADEFDVVGTVEAAVRR